MLLSLALHCLWPQSCLFCGAVAEALCPACVAQFPDAPPSLRLPVAPDHSVKLQARCRHESMARDALLSAKYGGRGDVAFRLGMELAEIAPREGSWTLVAIPPHKERRQRLSGPSELFWLVRGLRKRTGYPITSGLRWRRPTARQTEKKSAVLRRALPHDSFVFQGPVPTQVLLLDDVCTTGTTLTVAARCLLDAGVSQLQALCWSVAGDSIA